MLPGILHFNVPRWAPYTRLIDFEGYDFSAATFAMEVRLYRDAPGAPLLALGNAAANAQGISCTVTTTAGVPTSHVLFRINKATLTGILLNAGRPGEDVRLVQDLHITGGGLPETRFTEGDFTILAGVVQNG